MNKAPKYVTEQLGCELDSLSSYESLCHKCQEYAARKGECRSMMARCQIVSFKERGNSAKRGPLKVIIEISESGRTHLKLSNCQTFCLSSVELHGRDDVT